MPNEALRSPSAETSSRNDSPEVVALTPAPSWNLLVSVPVTSMPSSVQSTGPPKPRAITYGLTGPNVRPAIAPTRRTSIPTSEWDAPPDSRVVVREAPAPSEPVTNQGPNVHCFEALAATTMPGPMS